MPIKRSTLKKSGVEIEIILDKEIAEKLHVRALREDRSINAVIKEAILRYIKSDYAERHVRLKALKSFRTIRFNLTNEDWKAIMKQGFYEH